MIPAVSTPHVPVLLDEVLAALAPDAGETIVDGTFGAGGYARAIAATGASVIAFDRDPDAIALGQDVPGLTLHHAEFSRLAEFVARADGAVFDIGVLSMHLDRAERGFAFGADGPLDMRMSQHGPTAADFVNTADEAEIADVLFQYGEERQSRRVARAVVAARPVTRTGELAAIVRRALGHKPHEPKDPATRTFQALRIHVNRELGELADGLAAAEAVLAPGGRLAVVTFHSLEDRIVKRFLRERSGSEPSGSRHVPQVTTARAPTFEGVARPVRAGEAELARNPRARSATLRAARRTAAPAWGETKSAGGKSASGVMA